MAKAPKLTAEDLVRALEYEHGVHGQVNTTAPRGMWAFIEEFCWTTGYTHSLVGRVDALAICCWQRASWRGHKLAGQQPFVVAYEIKVSRSDYLREIRQPTKRARATIFADAFYFVTPTDLVDVTEVPDDCGLLTVQMVSTTPRIQQVKKAPTKAKPQPSWSMMAALMRRYNTAQSSYLHAKHELAYAHRILHEHNLSPHPHRESLPKQAT